MELVTAIAVVAFVLCFLFLVLAAWLAVALFVATCCVWALAWANDLKHVAGLLVEVAYTTYQAIRRLGVSNAVLDR